MSSMSRRQFRLTLRRQIRCRAMRVPIRCTTKAALVPSSQAEASGNFDKLRPTRWQFRRIAHIWISRCRIWLVDHFISILTILCSCHMHRKVIQHIRVIRAIFYHLVNVESHIHRHHPTGECLNIPKIDILWYVILCFIEQSDTTSWICILDID